MFMVSWKHQTNQQHLLRAVAGFCVFVILICGGRFVLAFQCSPPDPDQTMEHFAAAQAVFLGRADKIHPAHEGIYSVDFIVYRAWKGVEDSRVTIRSRASDGFGRTGFTFEEENVYLVFAYGEDWTVSSFCDLTMDIYLPANIPAQKYIQALGSPRREFSFVKNPHIDELDDKGHTRLHNAISRGQDYRLRQWIDEGADLEVKDKESARTVLQIAVDAELLDVARVLLEAGANPNVVDLDGYPPIHRAVHGYELPMLQLLYEYSVDIDAPGGSRGETPLMSAVAIPSLEIVNFLIRHGAKLEVKNQAGQTPLAVAVEHNRPEIVKLLLDSGAQLDVRDTANGDTPLIRAVLINDQMAKELIARGADVNIANHDGLTALHYAAIHAPVEVVQLLIDHGADLRKKDNRGSVPYDYANDADKKSLLKPN